MSPMLRKLRRFAAGIDGIIESADKVQKYPGHSDIRTTQRYAYLNPEIRHDEVQKLPSYRTYVAQNVVQFCKVAK